MNAVNSLFQDPDGLNHTNANGVPFTSILLNNAVSSSFDAALISRSAAATGGSPLSFDIVGIDANPDRITRAIFGFNYFRIGEEIGTSVNPSNQRRVMVINGSTRELLLNIQPGQLSAAVENQMIIDAVNSVVVAPPDPYLVWAAAQGLTDLNNGENEDPDGDGLVSLLEYAFGTNPLAVDPPQAIPHIETTASGTRQFVFQRNKTADVSPLTFQQTTNLSSFSPYIPGPGTVSIIDQGDTERVTLNLPAGNDELYLTITATRP